ncbi:hypothetical protein ExPECSC076_04940 [Escherichia coli]|nr:hypothetical protein ExPECSC033_00795 [Escherichia coli]GCQ39896.1 hypothetical protein ExPECSC076_04940 [Escherichia coli]GDU33227.1 hypothetical protein BvCmsSINP032_04797 [Escherichia coli]
MNCRCIPSLAVRNHIVIRGQLNTPEIYTVKNIPPGITVPHRQTGAQGNYIPLQPGVNVLPVILAVPLSGTVTPAGVVPKTPAPDIQSCFQIQIGIIAGATIAVAHPITTEVIIQQCRCNSVIPVFRRNITTGLITHIYLRNGQVQSLLPDIKPECGTLNHGIQ